MKDKMVQKIRKELLNYVLIIVGTGMFGLAYQCIYDQVGLVTGGFTGIAIILRNVTVHTMRNGIPLWLTTSVLNVPVFLFAYIRYGKKFVGKALFGTVMLSVWLYLIPAINLSGDDYMLAALFGGVFSGAGIGLVLRAGATTGGTDMVASLFHARLRQFSVAQIMQILDGAIVLAGIYFFGLRPTLYAVVAIFVTTKVSDAVLEGFHNSKAAFIITKEYTLVAGRLMNELERGVTGLSAKGMYTGEDKCVLYCVVSRKEMVRLKDIVHEVDENAFVIVTDAREVLGEGFMVSAV